jgi:hypothetical protein
MSFGGPNNKKSKTQSAIDTLGMLFNMGFSAYIVQSINTSTPTPTLTPQLNKSRNVLVTHHPYVVFMEHDDATTKKVPKM